MTNNMQAEFGFTDTRTALTSFLPQAWVFKDVVFKRLYRGRLMEASFSSYEQRHVLLYLQT